MRITISSSQLKKLAQQQRGRPELAMLAIQSHTNGGVLSYVVEHAGDLIHRMSNDAEYGRTGREYVEKKVNGVLRELESGYGFERDYLESLVAYAKQKELNPDSYVTKLNKLLTAYKTAHSKLPVYNYPHWLAREINIKLGDRDWKEAILLLKKLRTLLDSDYDAQVLKIEDPKGNFKPL